MLIPKPEMHGNWQSWASALINSLEEGLVLPVQILPYKKASLPSASQAKNHLIMVTDEAGGHTLCFSDGTNWRRVQDRAVVS